MLRLQTFAMAFLLYVIFHQFGSEADRRYSSFGKKSYRPPSPYTVRRSSVKRDRLKYLFPTAAAIGGIYIASQMRPHIPFRSYRDLYDHTVCEGLRTEYDESTRTMRTYNYFVCPDDPNQPFERYCCTDHRNSGGFCCSYDEKARSYSVSRWGTIAGSIAALAVIALVVAVIYCLCCRRNRRLPSTLVSPTLPTTANGGSGAYPGIPTSTCPYPTVMTSTEQRYTPYPSSGVPLQPGSGWQATPMTQPGFGWANSPPPPYSAK